MRLLSDVPRTYSEQDIKYITLVQSMWKGYRVRRDFLVGKTYALAKAFIDSCEDMSKLPQAKTGVTKVYFPEGMPVALKALGVERSRRRFFAMCEARDVCARNGYKHLLIPHAYPYKGYNIEQKLPVIDVKLNDQVALYENNKAAFAQAVKEFTGFLCQTIFPDILTYSHPYQTDNKIPLGRYDNIPLLLEEVGKIVLIDLGGLKVRTEKISAADALETFKTALYIFPYHFEEIKSVVRGYCPEVDLNEVQTLSEKVLSQFATIYSERALTLSGDEITEDLRKLLSELILRKEISFFNFYYNREKKLHVRIHY